MLDGQETLKSGTEFKGNCGSEKIQFPDISLFVGWLDESEGKTHIE